MSLLDPEGVADCGTCLDGIDNNCDGQIDCADPACAPCFVGQGVGCGGGDQSPCAGAGCSARPSTSAHRGLVLGLVGLLGLLLRRPRRSAA
jgi:MYXO-CTERM domain-containing protein